MYSNYEFDSTASSPNNLVINEVHALSNATALTIIAENGLFYTNSLIVANTNNPNVPYVAGVDYSFQGFDPFITAKTGFECASAISFNNSSISGSITMQYQAVGGLEGSTSGLVVQLQNAIAALGTQTHTWAQVQNKPTAYPPLPHPHNLLTDLTGLNALTNVLGRIEYNLSSARLPSLSSNSLEAQINRLLALLTIQRQDINTLSVSRVANGTLVNSIINGNMIIPQRGTSGPLTASPKYICVDRWAIYQGVAANGTAAQVPANLTGFQYALKVGRNNTSTLTGNIWFGQALETVNSIPLQGKTVTLSFYAKAGSSFSGSVFNSTVVTGTGTDQSISVVPTQGWTGFVSPINGSATLTTNWQCFTYTGTIPQTATQIAIAFSYTPVGTAANDDNVYITGVQLEIGSVKSPFEIISYQNTLDLCYRYYYRISSTISLNTNAGSGRAYSTTNGQVFITLPKPLRALPVTSYSALTDWNSANTANSGLPTAMNPVSNISSDYRIVTIDLTGTYVLGQTIALNANNTHSAWIAWDAEL